jgi:hypothetical protein
MAYALSASLAAKERGGRAAPDRLTKSVLETALSESVKFSDTFIVKSESNALDYAGALLELSRACALRSDAETVEKLLRRIPCVPKTPELDFITAEAAYVLGDLAVRQGRLDKAESVYSGYFPRVPSLGSELIRLDLAAVLAREYLDRGEPAKAERLFLSYFKNREISFPCQVPPHSAEYASCEFSRILGEIAAGLREYTEKNPNFKVRPDTVLILKKFSASRRLRAAASQSRLS